MHDKIIIGIHESKDKCEACGGPHPVLIDLTQDVHNPIDLTQDDEHTPVDFSQDPDAPSDQDFEHQDFPIDPQLLNKNWDRRDSGIADYPVLPTDAPVDAHPAPMDTSA